MIKASKAHLGENEDTFSFTSGIKYGLRDDSFLELRLVWT